MLYGDDKSPILTSEFLDIFLLPQEKRKHSHSCLEHPMKGKGNVSRVCKFSFCYGKYVLLLFCSYLRSASKSQNLLKCFQKLTSWPALPCFPLEVKWLQDGSLGRKERLPESQLCRYPVPMCAEHFKQRTQDVPGLVQDGLKIVHSILVRIASPDRHLILSRWGCSWSLILIWPNFQGQSIKSKNLVGWTSARVVFVVGFSLRYLYFLLLV